MTTTGTRGRRRRVLIDVLIATVFLLLGWWISTWAVTGVVILAVVVAVVMGLHWYLTRSNSNY